MERIARSALLELPVETMFNLVKNVDAYCEFLPWCASSRVLTGDEHCIEAELRIKKGLTQIILRTRNRLQPPHSIRLEQIAGPFSEFAGLWTFRALSKTACKIELQLDFRLQGRFRAFAGKTAFGKATDAVMDAFCEQARRLKQGIE